MRQLLARGLLLLSLLLCSSFILGLLPCRVCRLLEIGKHSNFIKKKKQYDCIETGTSSVFPCSFGHVQPLLVLDIYGLFC